MLLIASPYPIPHPLYKVSLYILMPMTTDKASQQAETDELLGSLGLTDSAEVSDTNDLVAWSPKEKRAISLLGDGATAEQTAAALGVTPSAISQMLSKEAFSDAVAEIRYDRMKSHGARDDKYDAIEDKLLEKLENSLGLLFKPQEVLKAITVINGAKRRGGNTVAGGRDGANIVNITIPTVVHARFVTDAKNQVIKAGDEEMLTLQSGTLLEQVENAKLEAPKDD